jgi:hypothetical protein
MEEARTLQLDVADLKVFIGIPCGPSLPWQTVQSIMETTLALKNMGARFEVRFVAGCSIVQMARNKIAVEFLRSPGNRLFMIDSDMQWQPDAFLRLLALSTKMDIVCAAYRLKQEEQVYCLKWDEKPLVYNDWGCLEIDGLGAGFCVVHRRVIEELAAAAPKVRWQNDPEPIPYIFDIGPVRKDADGIFDLQGEDIGFFADARKLGFQVYLDPNVTLGHIGTKVYSGSIRDAMRPA